MTKILLYPDVKTADDMADLLSRMNWHFSPYLENVDKITILSAVSTKRAFEMEAPYYLDASASPSESSKVFQDTVEIQSSRGLGLGDWEEAFDSHDLLIVWRIPTLHIDKRRKAPVFQTLQELQSAIPKSIRMVVADRDFRPSEASLLLTEGLKLHGHLDDMKDEHHARFFEFAKSIKKDTCHILGTGPSLSEIENYDLSKGDVISCNSLVINDELMAQLRPKVICAADPIFHAGPSSYAAAFRGELIKKMDEYDFHLFVPQRDYLIYTHCVPSRHHHRIIAVPLAAEGLNLDLSEEFRVEPFANVLTLLMFPIGASCYENITVSGCDGRPLSENQYFWGHHKASQINDKMEDIKKAHPGFFNISFNDYYERHCDQVEYLCETFEESGGTVTGLTASFVSAFRKRGAAEPLRQPRIPLTDAPLTILSLNPDLSDNVGHFWNYEAKLAPEFGVRNFEYRVASNSTILDNFDLEMGADGTLINEGVVVDPILMTNSYTLANRIGNRADKVEEVAAATLSEYAVAIDRARAAAKGNVLVYMYTGSLEHLEIIYELLFDRPDVCAVVNLFWTKALDVWQPQFAQKYGWLLQQIDKDPRIHATAMTAHQAHAIKARTGVSLDVACHPSPLIGDQKAKGLIGKHAKAKKKKLSVFFPSANRIEKGSKILGSIAEHLAVMLNDRDFELVFRSDPAGQGDVTDLKSVSGGYRVLEGNIEEDIFIKELASADAVVLPYLPPDFADRTSGLTIDAAYAGTPVVVMAGTWLAQCVSEYKLGSVVDVPDPHTIAKATYNLLVGNAAETINVKAGAQRYLSDNSWKKLAVETSAGARIPATQILNEKAGDKMEALNESVSPLLGEVDSGASGSIDIPRILEVLVKKRKLTGLRVIGFGDERFVTELTNIRKPVSVVGTNPYLAGRILGQPKSKLKNVSAQMVTEETLLQSYGEVSGAAKIPYNAVACLNVNAARYKQLKKSLDLESCEALAIDFEGMVGSNASALSQKCGNWLSKAGYSVIMVERWFRPNKIGQSSVRRAVSYPYMSALPYAPTTVLAFRRDISVEEQKRLLMDNSENCGFVERATREMIAAKLWQVATHAAESEAAIAIASPGGKNWKLEGFEDIGRSEDGFVKLSESPAFRVHRTTMPFKQDQGAAVTIECDVKSIKARFAVLWITDVKFQTMAEATFDIASGRVVSLKAPSGLVVGDVFGGIAKLPDSKKSFHIWLSIPTLNTDQKLFASVVTRATASGSMQYKGSEDRVLALRNFSATFRNAPSLFSDRNAQPSIAMQPKTGPAKSTSTQSEYEDIVPEVEDDTPIALIQPPQPFKPELELHALGVVGEKSNEMGWKNNGTSKIVSSSDGLQLQRNGAGHADQCFTMLGLDQKREYELILKVSTLQPRFMVLINNRPIIDATTPGVYSVVLPPRLTQARIDIKAVDSAFAFVDFTEISLNSRDFRAT